MFVCFLICSPWRWDIAHPQRIGLNIHQFLPTCVLPHPLELTNSPFAAIRAPAVVPEEHRAGKEGDTEIWVGVSQLATAQGHILGTHRGWVGNTNLSPTDFKHLLPERPSQGVNRDNPAQGHESHLCHLSPCGQGTFLCQARVPIPGKWDSTESLSQSLGNFPLLFPQPGASSRP